MQQGQNRPLRPGLAEKPQRRPPNTTASHSSAARYCSVVSIVLLRSPATAQTKPACNGAPAAQQDVLERADNAPGANRTVSWKTLVPNFAADQRQITATSAIPGLRRAGGVLSVETPASLRLTPERLFSPLQPSSRAAMASIAGCLTLPMASGPNWLLAGYKPGPFSIRRLLGCGLGLFY
jgi:hypothetical protein